jgi:hypothetical protein
MKESGYFQFENEPIYFKRITEGSWYNPKSATFEILASTEGFSTVEEFLSMGHRLITSEVTYSALTRVAAELYYGVDKDKFAHWRNVYESLTNKNYE